MIYLTHPKHGAMHAMPADVDNLVKLHGWTVSREPTAAEVQAAKRGARAEALKAELAEIEEAEEAPKRRGRPPKA